MQRVAPWCLVPGASSLHPRCYSDAPRKSQGFRPNGDHRHRRRVTMATTVPKPSRRGHDRSQCEPTPALLQQQPASPRSFLPPQLLVGRGCWAVLYCVRDSQARTKGVQHTQQAGRQAGMGCICFGGARAQCSAMAYARAAQCRVLFQGRLCLHVIKMPTTRTQCSSEHGPGSCPLAAIPRLSSLYDDLLLGVLTSTTASCTVPNILVSLLPNMHVDVLSFYQLLLWTRAPFIGRRYFSARGDCCALRTPLAPNSACVCAKFTLFAREKRKLAFQTQTLHHSRDQVVSLSC